MLLLLRATVTVSAPALQITTVSIAVGLAGNVMVNGVELCLQINWSDAEAVKSASFNKNAEYAPPAAAQDSTPDPSVDKNSPEAVPSFTGSVNV